MSAGTLWANLGPYGSRRIQAVAAYGDVSITIGEPYEHEKTNKTPEFLAKFPVGKVPAFETSKGVLIFETIAIAGYVARLAKNVNLLGSSLEDNALINQWIAFMALEVSVPIDGLIPMFMHLIPYNKPAETHYRERIATAVNVLENHLKTRTYFVGDRITLADISIASDLRIFFNNFGDTEFRAKIPNTVRFFNTIANHPKIKPAFGEVKLIEKTIQYTPPPKVVKEKAPATAAPPSKSSKEKVPEAA